MLKKLAIFVEGLTEQEFAIRLLKELAGKRGISFNIQKQHRGHLSLVELRSHPNPDVEVLIANCDTDNQVKSQIAEQYDSLNKAGYSLIIGLRDVHPLTHKDIPTLLKYMSTGLPNGGAPIHLHLAILEVEAWFLEELTHFERIDPNITKADLLAGGFDPENIRAFNLENPARILDEIYKRAGKRYTKQRNRIQRTIDALCYEDVYIKVRQNAPSLDGFIGSLEAGIF